MGGDRSPSAVVEGAVAACRDGLGPIILTGPADRVQVCLDEYDATDLPIEIHDAPDIISMSDSPTRAAKSKRESSIHRGFELIKSGRAAGFVSAGNSGAIMAVGLMALGRVKSCARPALVAVLPTPGKPTVLLDVGANTECRAAHLVQFGVMGSAYASNCLGIKRPRVALLSNGPEVSKGTETLREAHRLLNQTDLDYQGFVEGRTIPTGQFDVIVCDGLVGNVVLKLSEALVASLFDRIKDSFREDLLASMAVPLVRGPLTRLGQSLDWERVGGAALLGLKGISIIAHGDASPKAIASAIERAREYHRFNLVEAIGLALEEGAPQEAVTTAELPFSRTSSEFEREET